jgi:hypothetical protein
MSRWFFASPYNVTCGDIGNCSAKTPTIDVAFTNAAHLIIGLVGMLAVVVIIVSGLQMMLSAGNAKQVQTAKQTLTYAVVGVVVAILAYAIVSFIATSVK